MSITFYPDESGTDTSIVYGDPVPVIDAFQLYEQCVEHNLSTDWYDVANTISLVAGEDPSVAYLLILKKHMDGVLSSENDGTAIDAINRSRYNHRITLMDAVRDARGLDPLNIDGWVFHSAKAITGTSREIDLDSVYLVKFVDKRFLFAMCPNEQTLTSSTIANKRRGYNIVSSTRSTTDMTYDPSNINDFPYDLETVVITDDVSDPKDGHPYDWDEILDELWDQFTRGISSQEDPAVNAFYPEQTPLDIRPENYGSWKVFCEILKGTGNEIYPELDGTYSVRGIDENYQGLTVDLEPEESYLIEANWINPEWRRIPSYVSMVFLNRNNGAKLDSGFGSDSNRFYEPDPGFSTSPLSVQGPEDTLLEEDDITELNASIAAGVVQRSGDSITPGIWGIYTSILQTAVWKPAASETEPTNNEQLRSFSEFVLTKYLKARIQSSIDSTYGYFLSRTPTNQYEQVTWFIGPGGPSTRLQSFRPNIDPSYVPVAVSGGGGSAGGSDGGHWGIITATATPGNSEIPTTTGEVQLGPNFGSLVLTGVKNYSPDQGNINRTCRVSQHLGDWVFDWWSCNEG